MILTALTTLGLNFVKDLIQDKGEDLVTEGIRKVTGIDISKEKELSEAQIRFIKDHRGVQEIENTSKGLRVLIKPVMFENLYTEINDMIKCEEIYLLRSSIQEIQSIIEKISTILETKGDMPDRDWEKILKHYGLN